MQDETLTDHHPSCHTHCVHGCSMSPRHPRPDGNPRVQVRTFHDAPVPPTKRPPPPLWERIDDWGAVIYHRETGCEITDSAGVRTLLGLPLPATDGYERAARHDFDRWLRIADRDLDDAIDAHAIQRKTRATRALDVDQIATMVRSAFPGFTSDRDRRPAAAVVRRGTARQRELLALVTGEAPAAPAQPSRWDPMHEATRHLRDVFTVHIWALALILFGREKDTVSDYALGRLLAGEPVKDTRAPFANAAHALSVASRALPGLGGGSCAWPTEDPRMRRRTWAKAGEMAVRGGQHGTDSIRGEAGVHRVLDARNVARRAGLEPHERAAVAVLNDREMSRDEKTVRLREIEAHRRGLRGEDIMTDKMLREATADVSDGALIKQAQVASDRASSAIERVSREGDVLAPQRKENPKRVKPIPRDIPRMRADLPGGCL